MFGVLYVKGLLLVLVINKLMLFVVLLLDVFDIVKYFIVVIGGDDVQNKKLYLELLLLVVEKFFLVLVELLFVGDLCNDIQVVKVVGCCFVGLIYGYNYGELFVLSELDYFFDQFNEFLFVFGLLYSEIQELKYD